MPSFKIAGKSKEDLVAIAQIAGLLTVSKARRMSKADLIAFLEAENAKAAATAEPATPEQTSPDQPAAQPARTGQPADLTPGEADSKKEPSVKTGKTQKRTRQAAAATPDAGVSGSEPARKTRRVARKKQQDSNPVPEPATERASGNTAKKAAPTKSEKTGQTDDVETEPAPVAKTAPDQKRKTGTTSRTTSRTRQSARKKAEESASQLQLGDVPAQTRTPDASAPADTQAAVSGETAAPAEMPQVTTENTSPEAAEAATEKEVKETAGQVAATADGNRRMTSEFGGSMTRIPRSRITTRPIRPGTDDQDTARSKPEASSDSDKPAADQSDVARPVAEPAEPGHKAETPEGEKTAPADVPSDASREKKHLENNDVQGGVLEIMPDGYGFLRRDNYLQGNKDIYVPPQYIRRFNLRAGDFVSGPVRLQRENDRYQALLYIKEVNGHPPEKMIRRPHFDRLTPIYPNERFVLETVRNELSTRIIDLVAPIGKGQRGMIVSPPKAGKTILLQKIANAISVNNPDAKLIVLLIDERPEEVTDMQRSINGEVVYSTFDKTPENHTKVVELVLERAMRLVELKQDVIILLDSMTRLARAYNLTINPTGRTLSGGLDPGALYGPKRFFGAARNIENGGSLTIIATSLIETGSRMDEVIFEEFKGTGNMEVYLDRKLSEKRIFPAIDINKSGTRREELLMNNRELDAVWTIRKAFSQLDTAAVTEAIINLLLKTKNNEHFISSVNVSFNDKNVFEAMRGTRPASGTGANGGSSYNNGGSSYNNGGYNSSYRRGGNGNQNDDD